MAEVILMPRLSDTMTEGVIAAWHKKVGDSVKKGDLLAEVETDKATMDLESYKDGTLLYMGTDKGGKVQVNDLLAIIGAPGEDISALAEVGTGAGGGGPPPPPPRGWRGSRGADGKGRGPMRRLRHLHRLLRDHPSPVPAWIYPKRRQSF